MSRHKCAAGAWFWSGHVSKEYLRKKNHQKAHCFLAKQPQIALAWTWKSRGSLQRERGPEWWNGPAQREFPTLSEAGAEGRSRSQRAGGMGRRGAGCWDPLCWAEGSGCQAAHGDAVAAPTPSAPAGLPGRGAALGGGGGTAPAQGLSSGWGQSHAASGQAGAKQPALLGEGNS